MSLQAEFDFTGLIPAQRQKIQRLQIIIAAFVALLIFFMVRDVVYCALLELILLLMFFRERHEIVIGAAVERLMVNAKSGAALINGSHYSLSMYRLDYFSASMALVRLKTMTGEAYFFWVFSDLLGMEKYRQLIALLKAKGLQSSSGSTGQSMRPEG